MRVLSIALYLLVPGVLPAYALSRAWALAPFLAVLVTALAASLGGIVSVLVGGAPLPWMALVLVSVNGVAVYGLWSRGAVPRGPQAPIATGFIVVTAAMLLRGLRTIEIDWDARVLWFGHARWFYAGGGFVWRALGNPAMNGQRDYPPLIPTTVAAYWHLHGGIDYRTAQICVALLNYSAVVLACVAFPRLFRRASAWPAVVGAAIALGALAFSGANATNGYADLLWAAAAAAAVMYLLVAPVETNNGLIGIVALSAAALTKNEGLAAAVFIGLLAGFRYRHTIRRRPALLAVGSLLVVWPIMARVAGADSEYRAAQVPKLLTGDHAMWTRLGPTLHAINHYDLVLAIVAGACTLAGALTIGRVRRRLHLGTTALPWTVTVAVTLWTVSAYLVSPTEIHQHLDTSVDRATIAPRLLLLAIIGVWSLIALTWLDAISTGHHGHREADSAPEKVAAPPERDANPTVAEETLIANGPRRSATAGLPGRAEVRTQPRRGT